MIQNYLLGDLSRKLGIAPYRITYAISVGAIPETESRLGGKRVFTERDLEKIASYFGVAVQALPGGGLEGQE